MFQALLLSSFVLVGFAKSRIKSLVLIEGRAEKIYLSAGRVSLLRLPCLPSKVLLGSPNDLSVSLEKKEIHLLLKRFNAQPTNLIIKCNEKVLTFDIVPSKQMHNDFLKVLAVAKRKQKKEKITPRKNAPSQIVGGLSFGGIKKVISSSKEKK